MLTPMGSFIMMVGTEIHMGDLYVGDMFYNFLLYPVLAKYYGVDLGSYLVHTKDHQVTPLDALGTHHDRSGFVSLLFHPGTLMGK